MNTLATLIKQYNENEFLKEFNTYIAYKIDYKLFNEFKGIDGISYTLIDFLTTDLFYNVDSTNFTIEDIKTYLINHSNERCDLSDGCGIVVSYYEFDQFFIQHKNDIDTLLANYSDNVLTTLSDYSSNKGYYNLNNLINDIVQLAISEWTRQFIDFISNELNYNELVKVLTNNLNKDNCRIFE